MGSQLDLLDLAIREGFRGSEPVREPVRTGGDLPVPEPVRKCTNDSRRFNGSPFRGEESGTGSDKAAPSGRERVTANALSPAGRGGRGPDQLLEAENAELRAEPVREPGADPRPAANSEQNALNTRTPTLRPYQLAAIGGVEREWERGVKRTLAVLPTGTGKTVVFAELAKRSVTRGRRVLVLAHRTELLEQARNKLTDVGVWAAIEKADQRAGFAPVVVASVQTLQRKRLAALDPRAFDVVIDEAHHATAASYRAILQHFDGARVLGVTATPDRGDGKALGEVFESVAYRYEMREAIRDGWLAPIVARRIFVEGVDLSTVRSRAGDLASDELSEIMSKESAVHAVVAPLLEQAGPRRTIVFAVDVAHAKALGEVLERHHPGCSRVAHGELEATERARILADFRAGAFQFLLNCALYTEGFDEPSLGCVATVRPTKSRALFVQMVGRGTRLHPGKRDCLLLDFTGNAGKHKLVGPLDALAAGEITDEQRREADRLLVGEQQELDGLLEAADAELKRRRERYKLTAAARYFTTDVDPFFGDELGPPITAAWAQEPAGQRERLLLEQAGFDKLPLGLTKGDAVRLQAAVDERRRLRLSTLKQVRLLRKVGVDARNLTLAQASARIGILASHDWKPSALHARLKQLETDERAVAEGSATTKAAAP